MTNAANPAAQQTVQAPGRHGRGVAGRRAWVRLRLKKYGALSEQGDVADPSAIQRQQVGTVEANCASAPAWRSVGIFQRGMLWARLHAGAVCCAPRSSHMGNTAPAAAIDSAPYARQSKCLAAGVAVPAVTAGRAILTGWLLAACSISPPPASSPGFRPAACPRRSCAAWPRRSGDARRLRPAPAWPRSASRCTSRSRSRRRSCSTRSAGA